ncbi:MAG: ester cyclase [Saprospiraceae bacterium]
MKNLSLALSLCYGAFLFSNCVATKQAKMARTNVETIRLWFEEGWNHNRNEELLEQVFHPDWTDGNPLRPDQTAGLGGMRELIKFYRTAFPDAHFTITHIFGDAGHVAIRYEVDATHYGDAFGIPATGKRFTSTGLVIYEMKDGKIFRSWQELDLMGIVRQLRE